MSRLEDLAKALDKAISVMGASHSAGLQYPDQPLLLWGAAELERQLVEMTYLNDNATEPAADRVCCPHCNFDHAHGPGLGFTVGAVNTPAGVITGVTTFCTNCRNLLAISVVDFAPVKAPADLRNLGAPRIIPGGSPFGRR